MSELHATRTRRTRPSLQQKVRNLTRGRARAARKTIVRAAMRQAHALRFVGRSEVRLSDVHTRDQIPHLLNRRGLVGVAVEIGVKRGGYSDFLLHHWRGRMLISVDPWREAPPEEYVDRANVHQQQQEQYYAEACSRLRRHGGRSEIWRLTSIEAAKRVEDGSLDFVYVDARHDTASVREDLEAWYPKLRPGGLLAGHDYVDGRFPNGDFGVRTAVDSFFAEMGLPVHSTDGRPKLVEQFPSWLVELSAGEDG
jgi:hypothetical protein